MILFHGTNISSLENNHLARGSWLTSDPYIAMDFAESRKGTPIVYVFWVEEPNVRSVYFEDNVPAYQLKKDTRPIGALVLKDQKLTPANV